MKRSSYSLFAAMLVAAALIKAGHPLARDLATVELMVEACFRSDDYLEGQAAFAEKRAPRFRGA